MSKYQNDVTKLTENLYTGGGGSWSDHRKHAAWVKEVIDTGITVIIDMMIENDPVETEAFWKARGIRYIHLGTTDEAGHQIPARIFEDAWVTYDRMGRAGKTLVHCYMGVNRGPSVAFALLVADGMAPEKAFDLIRAQRPQAGLYYAVDGLKWLYTRGQGYRPTSGRTVSFKPKKRIEKFIKHRDKVYPPAEQDKVLHLIQKRHDDDWKAAQRMY